MLRITVGTLAVEPGGFNIVPGRCEFSIDVRAGRNDDLERTHEWITALLHRIAEEEALACELVQTHGQPPHDFDEQIVAALRPAAEAESARALDLTSGAGHDAMVIGRQVPAGMLFVPSRDGLSHNPDEYTSPEQCELGARVLERAVLALTEAVTMSGADAADGLARLVGLEGDPSSSSSSSARCASSHARRTPGPGLCPIARAGDHADLPRQRRALGTARTRAARAHPRRAEPAVARRAGVQLRRRSAACGRPTARSIAHRAPRTSARAGAAGGSGSTCWRRRFATSATRPSPCPGRPWSRPSGLRRGMSAAPDRVAVGDSPAPRAVGPLSVADFVRYAGASGDFNPLHFDEAIARAAGFESVFAQGMFSAGVLASFAADWLGADAVRRFQVRFLDVVWPGDTLTCAATVVRPHIHEGEQRVDVELTCSRQTGALAVRGAATFAVATGD